MKGKVYLGDIDFLGQRGEVIANYEDGLVYAGDIGIFGIRNDIIANYKNGKIYDGDIDFFGQRNTIIANYDGERLYLGDVDFWGFKDKVLATYDSERIYEGDMGFFGERGDVIATFEGAPDGALAAIAAIVLRLSSAYQSEENQPDTTHNASEDDGIFGFFGEVFSFWWGFIKACIWVVKAIIALGMFVASLIKRKSSKEEHFSNIKENRVQRINIDKPERPVEKEDRHLHQTKPIRSYTPCSSYRSDISADYSSSKNKSKKATANKPEKDSQKDRFSAPCSERREKPQRKGKLGLILTLLLCSSLTFLAVSIGIRYGSGEAITRAKAALFFQELQSMVLSDSDSSNDTVSTPQAGAFIPQSLSADSALAGANNLASAQRMVIGSSTTVSGQSPIDYSAFVGSWYAGNYYSDYDVFEEELDIEVYPDNSLQFSWEKYRIAGFTETAVIDPSSGIAYFSYENDNNSASGYLALFHNYIILHFCSSDIPYVYADTDYYYENKI